MNPMSAVGAGMAGIGGLAKIIMGAKQKKEGEAEKRALVRPIYERPDEAKEMNTLTALRNANTELAGQRQLEENIGLSTANALQSAMDFGSSADIYKAQINENNAMNNVGVQAAQQRLMNEQQRLNTLSTLADYSDKEFDYNQNIPYQEDRQSALSKINAGAMNMMSGLDTISSIGSSAASVNGAKGGTNPTPIGDWDINGNTDKARAVGVTTNSTLNAIKPPSAKVMSLGRFAFGDNPFTKFNPISTFR